MAKEEKKEPNNALVSIAGTIGGTLIGMLAVIGIFVREDAVVAMSWVAVSMAAMGIFLGHHAAKGWTKNKK